MANFSSELLALMSYITNSVINDKPPVALLEFLHIWLLGNYVLLLLSFIM